MLATKRPAPKGGVTAATDDDAVGGCADCRPYEQADKHEADNMYRPGDDFPPPHVGTC